MHSGDNSSGVFDALKAAAATPSATPRELIERQPELVRGVTQIYLAQMRPLLAFLYNASIDARDLLAESKKRWTLKAPELKPDAAIAGIVDWIQKNGINALCHFPFQLLQDSSANVYAAILLFECDKLLRGIKKSLDTMEREAGPTFSNHPFSRILRAAGNQYRHGSDWPEATALDVEDAKVLSDIGVTDVRATSAQVEVLTIIGGSGYFEFEERFSATILALLGAA